MESCCHPIVTEGAASLDLVLAFVTGLTISVGHCIGMCGPIQTAFSLENQRRGRTGKRFLGPLLRYHGGRVVSYVAIGGLFGLLGSASQFTTLAPTLGASLALGAGVLMVVLGLGLAGVAPTPNWGLPPRLGEPVYRWTGRLLSAESAPRQVGLGIANGFLPCGPVVAMALAAAAAAHPLAGMLLMLLYGLGTVPVLTVVGLLSSRIGPEVRERFYRIGAVAVMLIGVQLGLRGLASFGAVPHLRWGEFVVW